MLQRGRAGTRRRATTARLRCRRTAGRWGLRRAESPTGPRSRRLAGNSPVLAAGPAGVHHRTHRLCGPPPDRYQSSRRNATGHRSVGHGSRRRQAAPGHPGQRLGHIADAHCIAGCPCGGFNPETYELTLVLGGSTEVSQGRNDAALLASDFALWTSSRPYRGRALNTTGTGAARAIILHLPRTLVPVPEARLDRLFAWALPARSGIGRILADHLISVAREAPGPDEPDSERLGLASLDLAAGLLAARSDAQDPVPHGEVQALPHGDPGGDSGALKRTVGRPAHTWIATWRQPL
ncbi:hypothetical protein ACIA98_36125 [Streptomyces sp. NPDC051366]|uniref:AraC-like ligand-binding domain-containing protein n=1 Tax=Streptomyces sp. NPDC051366 TaxID=3365652 RepID=UPI0037B3F517